MIGHKGERAGTRELVITKYLYTIIYRLTAGKVRIIAMVYQSRQHPSKQQFYLSKILMMRQHCLASLSLRGRDRGWGEVLHLRQLCHVFWKTRWI